MKQLLILPLFLLTIFSLHAQLELTRDVIGSAGDHFEQDDLELIWTMGEVLTTTHQEGNLLLTEGFHQREKIITSTKEINLDFPIGVYPNPTDAWIMIEAPTTEALTAELFDLTGKLLLRQPLASGQRVHRIAVDQLPAAMYLLKVSDEEGRFSTYKVEKQ